MRNDDDEPDEAAHLYAEMSTPDLVILRHAFKSDLAAGARGTFVHARLAAIDAEIKKRATAGKETDRKC